MIAQEVEARAREHIRHVEDIMRGTPIRVEREGNREIRYFEGGVSEVRDIEA